MIQWFSSSLVRNLRPAHTCGGDNQLKWLPLYVRTLFRLFTHGVLAPPPMLLRNIIVTKVIAGLWAIFSFHLQSAAALVFAAALVETGAAQAWSSFLFIVKFTHKKTSSSWFRRVAVGEQWLGWEIWASLDPLTRPEFFSIHWEDPAGSTHTEPEPGFNWSLQKPTTPLMRFRFQKSLALMLTLIQGSLL